MWKCEACWDTYKVFDSQCHKQQAEKERIKRVTKHRSLYHVVWKQKKLKAATSKTFIETFISLKLLMNNNLKRKQKCFMNESCCQNSDLWKSEFFREWRTDMRTILQRYHRAFRWESESIRIKALSLREILLSILKDIESTTISIVDSQKLWVYKNSSRIQTLMFHRR